MTEPQFLKRPEDEQVTQRRPENREEREAERPRPDETARERPGPLQVPTPRLQYASLGLERRDSEVSPERLQAMTRAAVDGLGGPEERALRLLPEDETLTRLLNDEPVDFQAHGDLTPLVPEEHSRALGPVGPVEGQVSEEDFRREAELKQADLDEIERERCDLVQAFYTEQGHELLDPAEITRLAGVPPTPEAEAAQSLEGGGTLAQGQQRRSAALGTEGGERALRAVTERAARRFQEWLRREGRWHKRSEWLKTHLLQHWAYAADRVNPHTLLLAPRERGRFARYLRAESGETETPDRPRSPQDREAKHEAVKARTKEAAQSKQYERQLREARQAAVLATTKTVNKQWAEARDPGWLLTAQEGDLGASLKSPQNQALDAWLGLAPQATQGSRG